MAIPFGHHQLHNRYRFEGRLLLQTPLRVSSGRASDETDAPLMRDRAGIPYIPGSSLRGTIRSAVERIVAGVGASVGLKSCTLFSSDDCNEQARTFQLSGEKTDEDMAGFAENKLCDVCKLFGSTIYASRLVIEDAYPQPQGKLQDKTLVRDGVGIDRDTGTASEGVKFDYEVLETGPTFLFRMQVENVTDKDRLLINLILGLLKEGLQAGGKRAAGLGRIKLEEKSLSVNGFDNLQEMWQSLVAGKDPHKLLTWKEGA
jgi:CRISPR-associated RAMP protein (TIGR02581 family)